jgi:hypothetical protein
MVVTRSIAVGSAGFLCFTTLLVHDQQTHSVKIIKSVCLM